MKVPTIPTHLFKYGIKPAKACTESLYDKGKRSGLHLAGFDVETIGCSLFRHNDLYSAQIVSDSPENSHIFFPEKQGVDRLLHFFETVDSKTKRIFASAHNAGFDIGALLGKDVFDLMKGNGLNDWKGKVVEGNSSFLILKNKQLGKSITIADSMAWFKMSLKDFAKTYLQKDMEKLERPEFLGKRAPKNKEEFDVFLKYAEQDALIQLEATKLIYGYCSTANVRVCLTPAQLAGRVFQKDYLQDRIFLPNWKLLEFIARCYHGAQFTAFGRGSFEDVYYYDINSLYPKAAMETPLNFSNTKLEKISVEQVEKGYCGFVGVRFRFPEKENYPSLPVLGLVNDFPKLVFPRQGLSYCTTEELLFALSKNVEVLGFMGYGWYPEEMDVSHDLGRFMQAIYDKKEELDMLKVKEGITREQKNMREYYKLLLNSLIGKFCQRNRQWLTAKEVAGSLFKPDFGALILSKSRAIINELVSKHKALYSDTDCVLTKKKLRTGTKIGQLKNELGKGKGTLLSVRSKLYFVTKKDKLVKCAKHGFRQPSKQVFDSILRKRHASYIEYSVNRLTRLKEAYRRNRLPRRETSQTFRIMLADDGKRVYDEQLSTVSELLENNTLSRPLERL